MISYGYAHGADTYLEDDEAFRIPIVEMRFYIMEGDFISGRERRRAPQGQNDDE